jgi:hypothetical protein
VEVLGEDSEVLSALSVDQLQACFDLDRALQQSHRAIESLS